MPGVGAETGETRAGNRPVQPQREKGNTMKMNEAVRLGGAITIAITLGMLMLIPADASAEEVTVMRHTTKPLPGYGTLKLEIWYDGTDVQVIGVDEDGQIVLAREGTMSTKPTLEGTGAIEGILPADHLWSAGDGSIVHVRCETQSCARQIATRAESIVRASTMGAVQRTNEDTVMAKLCPSAAAAAAPEASVEATAGVSAPVPDAGEESASAPNEPMRALGAGTLCKWMALSAENLAAIAYMAPQGEVLIGETRYELRQAPWGVRPDSD